MNWGRLVLGLCFLLPILLGVRYISGDLLGFPLWASCIVNAIAGGIYGAFIVGISLER